jgi:hypothetical protein
MLTSKYVTLDSVIESVNRDTAFAVPVEYMDAAEWAGECLDLIKAPMQYVRRITDDVDVPMIDIVDGRGELPCDLVNIIQTMTCEGVPLRYSTDSFHSTHMWSGCKDLSCHSEATYILNNNYIFPSFSTGKLIMSYHAFPTDDNGMPMIPDNGAFKQAIKFYISEKQAFKLVTMGKLDPNIHKMLRQEKDWYVGKAQNAHLVPNRDKMESIKNQMLRIISPYDDHSTGHRTTSSPTSIINHSGYRR